MIDFTFLEKLTDLLNSSGVGSIEVKKNFWSTTVRISKGGLSDAGSPVTYQVSSGGPAAPIAANPGPAQVPAPAASDDAPVADEAPSASHLLDIKSPMVGTFYAQPEPGAEPYVKVGTTIAPGTTLCIIEAMKIMNPIDAEVSGVVREIAVQDSQPVEFGQVLFKVDPNG
jgi:acetyl-CoA carboxylase biotin carboxyl carrier protein